MKTSARLDRLPPYLFAELERKIAEKKAAGVDVISLGIGDPDTPTPDAGDRGAGRGRARPGHPPVPLQPRAAPELREAVARFYDRRFGVELDPETEIIPALGAKECIFNLNLAFLDPGAVALAADPGYPVYTGGPLLAGAEAELMPLLPGARLRPRPRRDPRRRWPRRARLMYLNYPNNPTGAVVPDGLFERAVRVRPRARRAGGARRVVHRDHLRRLRGAELPADRRAPRTSAWRCSRSPRATT